MSEVLTVVEGLTGLIADLEASRYFGTVELRFEAGRVTYIKKMETLKPEFLTHRENRGPHDRTER